MPITSIDGIPTRYEIRGSGPALLLFSPGGFDATIEAWASRGVYAQTKPLEHLSRKYTCIVFDRRESGGSGGRVPSKSPEGFAKFCPALLGADP